MSSATWRSQIAAEVASKAVGERGKEAEGKVKTYLEMLNGRLAVFDYSRIYDARSASGKFPSRPGDFEWYRKHEYMAGDGTGLRIETWHGLIEAKEVAHEFRLPEKNFKRAQLGKLKKRQLSGGVITCLVLHTTTKKWRVVPLDWLIEQVKPSWDLRQYETYDTIQDALEGNGVRQLLLQGGL